MAHPGNSAIYADDDDDSGMDVQHGGMASAATHTSTLVYSSMESPSDDAASDEDMVPDVPNDDPQAKALALDTVVLPKPVRILLLDIGQGNATLIMGPRDESILVDCGSVTDGAITDELVANATEVINRFLPKKRKNHLDYLLISHPDKDHVNKVSQVLAGFKIDFVVCGGLNKSEYNQQGKKDFGEFLATIGKSVESSMINQKGMYSEAPDSSPSKRKIVTRTDGFDIFIVAANAPKLTGAKIKVALGMPNSPEPGTPANCSSVVLCVRATDPSTKQTAQALVCADATFSTEYAILNSAWKDHLPSYLLSGGHHGSADSFSPAFLKAVNPSLVHFSANMHANFRHPTWEVVSRIMTNCPTMMANTECGPHDIVIGCAREDRPDTYQQSKINTPPVIDAILDLMDKYKCRGSTAVAVYALQLKSAEVDQIPAWLREVRIDAEAMKSNFDFSKPETDGNTGVLEMTPVFYYGHTLDEIHAERAERPTLTFELEMTEEAIKERSKKKNKKKKNDDLPEPTDDSKYWDSSTIDMGLISSLQGANTGVNWELTLFGGVRSGNSPHGITRF